jgi:arylsulfatase A-like enzyme
LFLRLNKLKLKREKFLWVIAVIAGAIIVTLNCFCFFFPGKSHPDHPSVILIICDTLRADHLGIYGYQRPQPNIEALARHSTLFSNAYTQAPATCPSMWNILTSRYKSAIPAKNADVTIAEYLKNKGYRTGAFISQHLLEGQRANLHHGFDLYDSWSPQDHHLLSRRRAASVTKAALKWIDKQRDKPFFAWVVYFDPHHPYIPPPEFRGYYNPENAGFSGDRREKGIHLQVGPGAVSDEYKTFLINAYDEEINYVDHQLGRLLSSLKSSGLYDRTMIILTADHGEELGDNENRWDHCMLLSQEEIWVPLLIKLPNQQQRSTVTKAVQTIDIYPTIIDYLERRNDLEFQDEMEGRSLLPFLTGEKPSEDHYAASFWRQQQCVVEDDLKYQVTGEKERLTNIKTGEEAENPEARRRLKERLRRLWEKNPERDISYQKEISKLQALGYIN